MSNKEIKNSEVTTESISPQVTDLDKNLLLKLLDSMIEEQNMVLIKE